MSLMRLLPQRRVPNRPRAAGSSQAGQRFQDRGPGDPDAAEQPPWLMRPAGIVAAGTAVAAAVLIGAVPALILAGTARGAARHPADSGRGRLVSATPLRTLATTAAVRAELVADGFDPAEDRYGVRTYRLVYRTVDLAGRPATASGLVALPIGAPGRLPVVSFTHGPERYRGDAPSGQPAGFEPAPAYVYASAGFAVSDPDYLGLGAGPGLQPWFDVPSETTAALDMLRATRAFAARQGHAVRRAVMVTGFSQGASAALGLGRALQDHADSWFRLGALAPISGAYDFRDRVCAGWTPAAPTRLYYATGDEQAVKGNTFSCQAKFAARGPRIPAVNVGAPDNHGSRHSGSNAAGAAAVVRWFRELERQPRPPASRA